MSDLTKRKAYLLSLLALVFTFLILNIQLLSLTYVFKWDAWDLFWPMFQCLAQALQEGRLPLWDPRPCCGVPFHADPLSGTFYPVAVLAGFLFGGDFAVYQFYWLGHWLFGAVGFFFLAKRLELSPWAAFVASVSFAFGGFFVGQAQHTVTIVSVGYIVWCWVLLDKAREGHILYAVPAGALFGLGALGGYPGMTIYGGLATILWVMLKYRGFSKNLALLALTFLCALVVLSPSYASFVLECRGYTDRVGLLSVREACNVNRFPFDALVSLVTPGITVSYHGLFRVEAGEAPMINGYFGVLGLTALAVVLAVQRFREQWGWLLTFMGLAFLFALGTVGGLSVIGYYGFPLLGFTKHTSHMKLFWILGGAILAGWIFDRLSGEDSSDSRDTVFWGLRALLLFLYVGFCAVITAWLVPEYAVQLGFPDTVQATANSLRLAVTRVGYHLIVIALFMVVFLLFRTSLARSVTCGLLALVVVADAAAHLHGNFETVGWNHAARETAAELSALARGPGNRSQPIASRIVSPPDYCLNKWAFDGHAYVRGYLGPKSGKYDALVGSAWPPYTETKFLAVLQNAVRFWLTPTVAYCADDDRHALKTLVRTDGSTGVPVFVHSMLSDRTESVPESVRPGAFGKVEVIRYEPELVELRVDAPAECWLFATERYAPGWRATVDGTSADLQRANFCFRALRIPQGVHAVTMVYSPWAYRPLLFLSWGFCCVVGVGWIVLSARGRWTSQRRT